MGKIEDVTRILEVLKFFNARIPRALSTILNQSLHYPNWDVASEIALRGPQTHKPFIFHKNIFTIRIDFLYRQKNKLKPLLFCFSTPFHVNEIS